MFIESVKKGFAKFPLQSLFLGMTGLEPAASWPPVKRATTCATSRNILQYTLFESDFQVLFKKGPLKAPFTFMPIAVCKTGFIGQNRRQGL